MAGSNVARCVYEGIPVRVLTNYAAFAAFEKMAKAGASETRKTADIECGRAVKNRFDQSCKPYCYEEFAGVLARILECGCC